MDTMGLDEHEKKEKEKIQNKINWEKNAQNL